jgi:uncharacterized membrane protein
MCQHHATSLRPALAVLAGVLVVEVVARVVANYPRYVPPDFSAEFLRGRESQFLGPYPLAFYVHILSGPVSLVLGLVLVVERFRIRFPDWHRALGRVQVGCVLLLVTPSGLWMARYAAAGPVAAVGLATLAIATATCVAVGARAAAMRRFADHRRWMWRCFLLLCSAVVLRLIGGFASVVGVSAPWFDPAANWASWLAPIAAFEVRERLKWTSNLLDRARHRDRAFRRRPDVSVR